MQAYCESCGAKFDIHETKCPYCGSINIVGAEEKYMEKMQGIMDDLADVDDKQKDDIKKETKKNIKTIVITVSILAAGFLILIIAYSVYSKSMEKHYDSLGVYESNPMEVAKWNEEHLFKLDEMYDNNDIDGLVKYYNELSASGDIGGFFSWEHSFLISQIHNLRFWMDDLSEASEVDSLTLNNVIFNILYIYNGDYNGTNLSEKDKTILLEEANIHIDKVMKRFELTEADLKDMQNSCKMDSGYIDPEKVSNYIDKHSELFR